MSKDINIMVKGNREMKVPAVDVERLQEEGWKVWTQEKPKKDYTKMKNDELKAILDEAKVDYDPASVKADLVELVKEYEEADEG